MRGKLTISLDNIRANYCLLATRSKTALCAAVVKANAYGLGIAPIAKALAAEGATDFFVALPEEGAELRALLPTAKIYVLNGLLVGEESLFLQDNLIPVLNDPSAFKIWQNAAKKSATTLPAVLHVDTGLNRLGFNHHDFSRSVSSLQGLDIRLVMSHLACADTHSHPMNAQQLERFRNALALLPGIKASLAASDGIFCGPEFHFDMVRPGAALYGLNPTPGQQNPMQPCVQLSVPILQIREVAQEGTAGYAATHSVKKGQKLATVSLGYADGFARSLSSKSCLFYKDNALPVIGRVSMDVVIVDISTLKEPITVGNMLSVFDANQTPDDLAKAAGTIGYEIMTSLGRRFERHYVS